MSQTEYHKDIFSYIRSQEASYKLPIKLPGNWSWSMKEHIETSYLYNHSQLVTGKDEWKPVKNITRPILNLEHRTEDIEASDVQIYVDDSDKYHLSFLVKKYHDDVFVQENDIDTFFDELNVSRIDYGGGLSKKLNRPAPEVVPLQSIAFCDQTDILSGPIGLRHFYSPDQLMEMGKVGWGDPQNGANASLREVVTLSRQEKKEDQNNTISSTPGKYIEVFEVHGQFPKHFLDERDESDESEEYCGQIHIVCFYNKKEGGEGQITLFKKEEKESPFKLIKRDPVYGRALGFGGAEELFESQVWVNYDVLRMQDMLDAASKTILKASGPNAQQISTRSKVKDLENLDIIDVADGDLAQVDTFPRNLKLFEDSIAQWEAHAQQMGAANDSIMGQPPTAGTPFKLQELVTQESHGLHEYRRGQYAKHLEEIYQDWIIPHIQKKITQGMKWLSELSVDDLKYVTDCVVRTEANNRIKEAVLRGEYPTKEEQQLLENQLREEFKQRGSKHFLEILKGEFKNTPLAVKVSVAGKSRNLAVMTDKLVNIFRFVISNPQGFSWVMQIPGMGKAFNGILEYAGLSPADFSDIDKIALPQSSAQTQVQPSPEELMPQQQYA